MRAYEKIGRHLDGLSRSDILDILSHVGITVPEIRPNKKNYKIRSPFRNDKHPSFAINIDTGLWRDVTQNESGNLVDLLAKGGFSTSDSITLFEKYTGKIAHSHPLRKPSDPTTKKQQAADDGAIQQTVITATNARRYQEDLLSATRLSVQRIWERWSARRITRKAVQEAGVLVGSPDFKTMTQFGLRARTDCVIYPVEKDENGNITNYKVMDYSATKEKRCTDVFKNAFFPHPGESSKHVTIVGGEDDALSLRSAGVNAVSPLAGTAVSEDMLNSITDCDILVCFDNQDVEYRSSVKLAERLYDANPHRLIGIMIWPEDRPNKWDIGDEAAQNPDFVQFIQKNVYLYVPYATNPPAQIKGHLTPKQELTTRDIKEIRKQFYRTTATDEEHGETTKFYHENVVRYILDKYHIKVVVNASDRKEWFIYNEGCWKKVSKLYIESLFYIFLRPAERVGGVYDKITRNIAINSLADSSFFDLTNSGNLINLNNCAYDLVLQRPVAHSPGLNFKYKSSFDFRVGATAPTFGESLKTYADKYGDAWINLCWEILGYSLTNANDLHVWFYFVGKTRRGKSTVLSVAQNLVGDKYKRTSFDPAKFRSGFYGAGLKDMRLLINADAPPMLRYLSELKMLTGGDTTSTDQKYGDQLDFEPTGKPLFSANQMFTIPDNEDWASLKERLVVLPFERYFRPEERNPALKNIFKEELPGIFNQAVLALGRLLERGRFQKLSVTESLIDSVVQTNSVQSFASECLEFGEDRWVLVNQLFLKFDDYMKGVTLRENWHALVQGAPHTKHQLSARIQDTFDVSAETKYVLRSDGRSKENQRVLIGVGLKPDLLDTDPF